MKPSHLLVPGVLIVAAGCGWLISLRAEAKALSEELEQQRTKSRQASEMQAVKTEGANTDRTALAERLAELQAKLAREQKATADLTAQKTALQAKVPKIEDGEIVVSFGRIRDMATEMGETVLLNQKMASRKDRQLTPEESQQFMNASIKLMSWLPEIADFEDTPAEISCLQAGTIAKAFDLNPPSAARVEKIISDHFVQMKAAGVTAASRARPGWREQRSAAITELMWKLRPVLPASSDLNQSLPLMLNIGAGMDQHVDMKVDEKGESKGSVNVTLPNWPRVPWLREKPGGPRNP